MSKKWNGQQCPVCRKGTLHDGIEKDEYVYRGRILSYEQPGAYCDYCEEGIIAGDEAAATDPLLIQFRAEVDKEIATELARIRKKLKLTQQAAALLTGGGKNAFSRYERGEAKPMEAVYNLFGLLDKHPALLQELPSSNAVPYQQAPLAPSYTKKASVRPKKSKMTATTKKKTASKKSGAKKKKQQQVWRKTA